ncbi:hypothetical protein Tco_0605252 [Tanacetum coccineum]
MIRWLVAEKVKCWSSIAVETVGAQDDATVKLKRMMYRSKKKKKFEGKDTDIRQKDEKRSQKQQNRARNGRA